MTRVLIVKAHPLDSKTSYVLRALEQVESHYHTLHPEDQIEVLDVFTASIPLLDKDLLEAMTLKKKGESISQQQEISLERFSKFTDQFLRADKVIIANPLWNLNVPSQLVAWINTINVSGVTFKYGVDGAVGLVKGKKILHIQSNGGIYTGSDPAAQYIRSVFGFLGCEEVHQVFIEGQSAHPDQAELIFNQAITKLKSLLETF